jgi:integrase/recombinase XerD
MRNTTGQAATISDNKLKQLFKLVSIGNHAKRNETIMALSHFLGLRSKELAALHVFDVIDANGNLCDVLRLQACYTKGNKHRDIPISNPKLRKILQGWISYRQKTDGTLFNRNSPLFRSQKGLAFSANSMTRMINNLYKNHGFEGCSSHTGRRSMITKLANKSIALHKIKILAGHSNIQTTLGYIDSNPDELGEIMKAL